MTQLTSVSKLAAVLASLLLAACGGGSSSEESRAVQGQGSGQNAFFDAAAALMATSETSEPFSVENFTVTAPETGEPISVASL